MRCGAFAGRGASGIALDAAIDSLATGLGGAACGVVDVMSRGRCGGRAGVDDGAEAVVGAGCGGVAALPAAGRPAPCSGVLSVPSGPTDTVRTRRGSPSAALIEPYCGGAGFTDGTTLEGRGPSAPAKATRVACRTSIGCSSRLTILVCPSWPPRS